MILDNQAILSDAQAITATANSTNQIDLLAPGVTRDGAQLVRNIGKGGCPIPFLVQVTEDFNNLTSLAFVFQTDEDVAFGTPKEVFRCIVNLAELKKGYILPIDKLPRSIKERYFRMRYEVTGTAPTTGKITSGIVAAVDGAYVG